MHAYCIHQRLTLTVFHYRVGSFCVVIAAQGDNMSQLGHFGFNQWHHGFYMHRSISFLRQTAQGKQMRIDPVTHHRIGLQKGDISGQHIAALPRFGILQFGQ